MESDIVSVAYDRSLDLLRRLSTEHGFVASAEDTANYKRIWARDGVIAGLAALASGDAALIAAFRATLETLKAHQHETGRIPSNVAVDSGQTSYGTTVGRIDATLWYVIGACRYSLATGDREFLNGYEASLSKALFYLECLELNGRGFIYVPQGGDWADEYINDGYILYDQMLYLFALSLYRECRSDPALIQRIDYLKEMIGVNFLPKAENAGNVHVYHEVLYRRLLDVYRLPLPVAYFSNHKVGCNLDSFATGLLLLSGVPKDAERSAIVAALEERLRASGFPILPAFYPVIHPNDEGWDGLERNFLFEFRNEPNEYHNGGLWPLVHGFFISSLPADTALRHLASFARTLERDGYSFPEYYDGLTFEAKGTKPLGFSAAAYILAHEAATTGRKPFGDIQP